MSQSDAYKFRQDIDYLGDFPGAQREQDRIKTFIAAGSVDLTDRSGRLLGAVSQESGQTFVVEPDAGKNWTVEQSGPVALEADDGAGAVGKLYRRGNALRVSLEVDQAGLAKESSLTSTLSREVANWTAGTLPVEQQTPVGIEDSAGAQVDPATESSLASRLAREVEADDGTGTYGAVHRDGNALLVQHDGVIDVSSRDGRNLGSVDVSALPDHDVAEQDAATLAADATAEFTLSAAGSEGLRGTVVSTGTYDLAVSWQTSTGTEIKSETVASAVAGGTATDIDLPARTPYAVVTVTDTSSAEQTVTGVAHLS